MSYSNCNFSFSPRKVNWKWLKRSFLNEQRLLKYCEKYSALTVSTSVKSQTIARGRHIINLPQCFFAMTIHSSPIEIWDRNAVFTHVLICTDFCKAHYLLYSATEKRHNADFIQIIEKLPFSIIHAFWVIHNLFFASVRHVISSSKQLSNFCFPCGLG